MQRPKTIEKQHTTSENYRKTTYNARKLAKNNIQRPKTVENIRQRPKTIGNNK